MCMEPISTRILAGCYKATVNESETITEAQPFSRVRSRSEPAGFGLGLVSVDAPIERS